jgi:hypothetical protein
MTAAITVRSSSNSRCMSHTAFDARETRRITAAEMKYMRITAGHTCKDYKTNTQMANELKITPV